MPSPAPAHLEERGAQCGQPPLPQEPLPRGHFCWVTVVALSLQKSLLFVCCLPRQPVCLFSWFPGLIGNGSPGHRACSTHCPHEAAASGEPRRGRKCGYRTCSSPAAGKHLRPAQRWGGSLRVSVGRPASGLSWEHVEGKEQGGHRLGAPWCLPSAQVTPYGPWLHTSTCPGCLSTLSIR